MYRKLLALGIVSLILFVSLLVYVGIQNINDDVTVLDSVIQPLVKTDETTETATDTATDTASTTTSEVPTTEESPDITENAPYYSATEVAKYLHFYATLPPNYLTKAEARDLGWDADKGNLWDVTEKGVIGGDRFGNREGLLPDAAQRVWYECDVNYKGVYRNAMRLVYSNDGLIYYTDDHYASFKKLYD